jgi:hypothetical protein
MAKALNPKKRHEYVLQKDRDLPENEQTTFLLRHLTAGEHASVTDRFTRGEKHAGLVEAATLGVAGWENLPDESGRTVPYPENGFGAMDWLPQINVLELGNAVLNLSTLDRETLGKLKPDSEQG